MSRDDEKKRQPPAAESRGDDNRERARDREQNRHTERNEQSSRWTSAEIARCEAKSHQLDEKPTFERTAREQARQDPPKDMESRFARDREIVQNIENLKPEQWKTLSFRERAESLRILESQLATSQDRQGIRSYVMTEESSERLQRNAFLRQIPIKDFDNAKDFRMTDAERIQKNYDQVIYHAEQHLKSDDPREAVRHSLEESRHAYQLRVIGTRPNEHSEVDALTREKWEAGLVQKRQGDPQGVAKNELEKDANIYVRRMVEEVYG